MKAVMSRAVTTALKPICSSLLADAVYFWCYLCYIFIIELITVFPVRLIQPHSEYHLEQLLLDDLKRSN